MILRASVVSLMLFVAVQQAVAQTSCPLELPFKALDQRANDEFNKLQKESNKCSPASVQALRGYRRALEGKQEFLRAAKTTPGCNVQDRGKEAELIKAVDEMLGDCGVNPGQSEAQKPTPSSPGPTAATRAPASGDDSVQWVGVAVSVSGKNFTVSDQANEVGARSRAKNTCEREVGSTCQALSVPTTWTVSAVRCSKGDAPQAFIAGSGKGLAKENAFGKAQEAGFSEDQCKEVFTR